MGKQGITWQQIAKHDSFLAGALAAREWEWWMEETAESQATSVGLVGEQRETFLQGWQFELEEQEQERKTLLVAESDEMAAGSEKGDPAAW